MPKKILVVDDEPGIVKVLESRLKQNGYSVITAGNGKEGLEKAKRNRPDLIILDILMPDMDGTSVASEDHNPACAGSCGWMNCIAGSP